MTTLREAAQQALEALEWYRQEYRDIDGGTRFDWTDKAAKDLRAALAQRKPLTEEELKRIFVPDNNIRGWARFQHIARAIEKAHGIE